MTKKLIGDMTAVASTAADLTLMALKQAIEEHGTATWVLAGGTSPQLAYAELLNRDLSEIDWRRVSLLIGDERLVPLTDPASNWGQIATQFLQTPPLSQTHQLVPNPLLPASESAHDYAEQFASLSGDDTIPRLDVVWLGVGEDGHTLSLFPGHENFDDSSEFVGVIEDSPKPPSQRITLTLHALQNVGLSVIFATGAGKKDALARAERDDLPIAKVAALVESHGGRVEWLFDNDAWTAN